MNEWVTLVLLIPAIVVPIVLLFGFAGCDLVFPLNPPTFEKAFEATLIENRGHANECLVLRIEPVRLFKSGSRVRITLQRPTDGNLLLRSVFISKAADTGNAYDSADDLTAVRDEPLAVLPDPNQPLLELEPVIYALDATKPLLIAFDIDDPGRVRRSETTASTDAGAFFGPVGEASQTIRSAGYTDRNRIYLVERIEVV
jgi:hypothetical protein